MQSLWLLREADLKERGVEFPPSFRTKMLSHCQMELGGKVLSKRRFNPEFNMTFEVLKFLQSAHSNGILTCEGFFSLEPVQLTILKQLLSDFDVTVVYVYRSPLPKMLSQWRFASKHESIREGLAEYFWTSSWNQAADIDKFIDAFGREHVRILDYEGVLLAGENLANVALQVVFGNSSALELPSDNIVNPSEVPTYYHIRSVFGYFSSFVRAKYGCKVVRNISFNY
ncbi:unnamed protein product [Durusdinium trenchii]